MQKVEWAGFDRSAPMSATEIDAVLFRIRAEFIEMPGLRLTIPQAARLWGLDPYDCKGIIDALVRSAFLRWTPDGAVTRM
jgi:hypothetical protein